MKPWITLAGSLLITAAAALLLPSLYQLETGSSLNQSAEEVLLPQPRVELSEDNLVDQMNVLPLDVPIMRVSWDEEVLTLDLKLEAQEMGPEAVYRSMAEAAAFCFYGTTNVRQLLLRVVAEDAWTGGRHLLLAADIRRNEWPQQTLTELRGWNRAELSEELKRSFRVTDTLLWRSSFSSYD